MKLSPSSRSPHDPNFLPGPLDFKFYYRVCKSTKVTLAKYHDYYKRVHCMTLDRITFPYPDAVIDVNSPNFY